MVAARAVMLALAALEPTAALALSTANAHAAASASRPPAAGLREWQTRALAVRRALRPVHGGVSIATTRP
jgi:hypothetical protein